MSDENKMKAVVARGRTVQVSQKKGQPHLLYKAGDSVDLPEAEVTRLRSLGYLKPLEPVEIPEGPSISGGQVSVSQE